MTALNKVLANIPTGLVITQRNTEKAVSSGNFADDERHASWNVEGLPARRTSCLWTMGEAWPGPQLAADLGIACHCITFKSFTKCCPGLITFSAQKCQDIWPFLQLWISSSYRTRKVTKSTVNLLLLYQCYLAQTMHSSAPLPGSRVLDCLVYVCWVENHCAEDIKITWLRSTYKRLRVSENQGENWYDDTGTTWSLL